VTPPSARALRAAATPWPALAALAIVVVMSLGLFGVDLVVDRHTADHTSALVENSMRSVALADDLRYQAYRLSIANLTPDQIASVAEQIEADAKAYDPIATFEGENDEWVRLQGLLAHLRHEQPLPTSAAASPLVSEIETSIARLVQINQNEARGFQREIAEAHHGGLVIDAVVGVATLGLAALVAMILVRALRRQRELLRVHLATLDERATELAAFAARTAHDLKGPLSPMRGYADILSVHDSNVVREPALRIGRAVERMGAIIDDLLEISVNGRPSGGRAAVTPVVREVVDELRADLRDAEVTVEIGDFIIACSANLFGQVLRNLFTNAAKYRSPERRLEIRVEADRVDDRIAIAISDNGIGMDADTMEHAFEPFYRAPGTSRPGHGLGLAIVRRTIETIRGSVSVASKLGEGTRVTIVIPVAS
jgi:signal transduction histidine kinase